MKKTKIKIKIVAKTQLMSIASKEPRKSDKKKKKRGKPQKTVLLRKGELYTNPILIMNFDSTFFSSRALMLIVLMRDFDW